MKKKVFVGLSGGVDSSVSAALLKEAGYDVIGVFIKVWQPDFFECTSKDDRLDAMRVCAKLGIPFKTLNLEKEYKKEVVDYMISEYKNGNTPNPDVMCNKEVKFGAFLKYALKNGADFVATGHYARNIFNKKSGLYELHKSKDLEKDQSYFLWTLRQKELSKILFPVGNLKKVEVRKLAKKFGLITATKKDSQGLCFVGKVDMKDFLKHFIKERTGNVIDEKGRVVGKHSGAFFYTLGERHGFSIDISETNHGPYYVIDKNLRKNILVVSKNPKEINVAKKLIVINRINFISEKLKKGNRCDVRFRYRQKLVNSTISFVSDKKISLKVLNLDPTISSGQSAVLYSGDKCLGGGVIV